MRILIVENDERLREPLAEGLRQAGYEVIEASNGREALSLLDEHSPDLLVTDISLPGDSSGWEVANHGRYRNPDLGVIYASGFPQERDREVPRSRHLTKPFKVGQLIAAATEIALERGL